MGCQQETQFEKDREAIRNYIAENNLEAQPHPSGLYYNISEQGGNVRPSLSDELEVRYVGRLLADDTSIFDQTDGQSTAKLRLAAVIQGWQIGMPFIGRGGEIRLYVPSNLAYGSQSRLDADGNEVIPANSPLIFDIELVDFE